MRSPSVVIPMLLVLALASNAHAQITPAPSPIPRFSASYELLEMSANRFKYFAGDVAYRLSTASRLRLVVMEVDLTQSHLSDDFWARIVRGKGVRGYMRGYEINYDRFLRGGLYVMANAGYIDMSFEDVHTGAAYRNGSVSLGSGVGYHVRNLFGVKGLFFNPSLPIRYLFNPIDETPLGSGTVQPIRVAPSVWAFVGFEF